MRVSVEKKDHCMSIKEYADCLLSLCNRISNKGVDFRRIEVHKTSMRFYFDEIQYDLVLDIKEAVGKESILPLWESILHRESTPDELVSFYTNSSPIHLPKCSYQKKLRERYGSMQFCRKPEKIQEINWFRKTKQHKITITLFMETLHHNNKEHSLPQVWIKISLG